MYLISRFFFMPSDFRKAMSKKFPFILEGMLFVLNKLQNNIFGSSVGVILLFDTSVSNNAIHHCVPSRIQNRANRHPAVFRGQQRQLAGQNVLAVRLDFGMRCNSVEMKLKQGRGFTPGWLTSRSCVFLPTKYLIPIFKELL